MTDDIAERARKLGGVTLRSIYDIPQHQRLRESNADQVDAHRMLLELRADNLQLTGYLRAAHSLCDRHNDVATASLLENRVDQAKRRTWFLSETING